MDIIGYRQLSDLEIADINEIKVLGEQIEQKLGYLSQPGLGYDQRWLAIGRTHLQEGLMALTRAIAKPTTF